MKTIKIFMLAFAICSSAILTANPVDPTEPTSKTTSKEVKASMNKQLVDLLSNSRFKVAQETTVNIAFTVNSENEIVVLNVKTDNAAIKNSIQNTLNYKELNAKAIKGQTYFLPLRLVVTD